MTEHWLWPFESHKLSEVNPSEVVIDGRLTECSTLSSGCGGVGILWRKGLNVFPIAGIQSDRICGIQIELSSKSRMSIIGACSTTSKKLLFEYTLYSERGQCDISIGQEALISALLLSTQQVYA